VNPNGRNWRSLTPPGRLRSQTASGAKGYGGKAGRAVCGLRPQDDQAVSSTRVPGLCTGPRLVGVVAEALLRLWPVARRRRRGRLGYQTLNAEQRVSTWVFINWQVGSLLARGTGNNRSAKARISAAIKVIEFGRTSLERGGRRPSRLSVANGRQESSSAKEFSLGLCCLICSGIVKERRHSARARRTQ